MKAWEGSPIPLTKVGHYEVGVILTGVTNRYITPNDRVYFEHGADRVLHAIQLYKMGKIDKIMISGGSGKLVNNETDIKEADELAKVLLLADIPKRKIIIENESRNTHESAVNCAKILKNESIKRVLLITSAFHIKRASLCFDKQNISFDTFSTDFYSYDNKTGIDGYFTPQPRAIENWNKIIREITGIIAYTLMGYI